MDKAIEAIRDAIQENHLAVSDGHYRHAAQAALTAYHAHLAETGYAVVPKVPTEGMVAVMANEMAGCVKTDWKTVPPNQKYEAIAVIGEWWNCMIEAAAKEQGDGPLK